MYKILIVDDEEKIRDIIKKYATFEGHSVTGVSNGLEAVELCDTKIFDIIIMDIMMPVLDGYSAVKEILKKHNIPIIMLSAKGEDYDKILGFELGIDDYVVKPFSAKELMLRIDAIMKRVKGLCGNHEVFEKQTLKVDFTARKVFIDSQEIDMSPKEYDLLFFLIKNKNIALSRETIITKVWGYDFFGEDRTLDTHIKLVRKKLGDYRDCIATLKSVGYRFDD